MAAAMKTTVVGLGLIGGSLAKDLRATGFSSRLTGVDVNPTNSSKALELGLVDDLQELEAGVSAADLVVVAVPVDRIPSLVGSILDMCPPEATVTDMGSTKSEIVRRLEAHPKRSLFVPSHPMAGTEHSGPEAAVAQLFRHKTAVICDREKSGRAQVQTVERMYAALGSRLLYMGSADHDLHAAYVSHLSHISSFVLANTVLDLERDTNTIFDLASGGFESTVRLAKSSPEMWEPIFEQNRHFVLEALDAYIRQLGEFRESILTGDRRKTHDLMDNANKIRRILAQIGRV